MKVLVTGASGMLGGAVADALAARGDDVTVLQRRPVRPPAPRGARRRRRPPRPSGPPSPARTPSCTSPRRSTSRAGTASSPASTSPAPATSCPPAVARACPGSCTSPRPPSRTTGAALVGAPAGPADPRSARGHYARSKAAAEWVALAADAAPDGPATVVVRPHLVWGPGDTQLVGRIVARARAGRLPVVGSGAALIDTTYVTNAADALVAALDRCAEARGQALVVSNGEPRPVAELLAAICRAAGVRPPRRAVPRSVALGAGAVVEARGRCVAGRGRSADDPVPRRAAQHGPLVRPTPHARGAALDPARQHRGGLAALARHGA